MNAVVVVTVSMIHMQNYLLLMLEQNINVEVFNLMSRTNETKYIEWHVNID